MLNAVSETRTDTALEPVPQRMEAISAAILNAMAVCDSGEDVVTILGQLACLRERIADFIAQAEARAIEIINEHGEFTIGDHRYYVGVNKSTKARDHEACMETALEITGGDVGEICKLLGASAWKYGAVRAKLEEAGRGDEFEALFETREVSDLKTGKPKRGLKVADTRFIK